MASIKISGLTEQTTASDTDLLPVASSAGMAKRMTLANFVTWLASKLNSKFAPAGYGLGSYAQEVSGKDINTITVGGAYWWQNASNAPFSWGYMIVVPSNGDSYCTQTIYSMTETNMIRRIKTDQGWVTEYVNPPMVLGVEYRTTERWQGKPVYTRLIDFGTLPNTTNSYVHDTIPINATVIYIGGVCKTRDGEVRPILKVVHEIWANTSYGYIGLDTDQDRTNWNATVTVKYTKE